MDTPEGETAQATSSDHSNKSAAFLQVSSRARAAFDDAIESIPDEEKVAYLQALATAPQLVEDESNPDHFLESTGFDPWKAALQVVQYWQARVDIFGDRAFLPLTCTGDGALSLEDVGVLRSGFLMVLPSDNKGRAVVLHDRSRLSSNDVLDPLRRLRCLFYVLSTLAETEANRRNGFVMLTCFGKNTRKATLGFNTFSKLYQDIMLVRLAAAHVVFLSSRSVFKTFVNLFVGASEKLGFLKGRIVLHDYTESKPEAIMKDLQHHGFDVEGLPNTPLGGLFTFRCFKGWSEDRRRLERGRLESNLEAAEASDAASTDHVASEDETRKRKRLDAAYSRRKRYRKKIEVAVMKEEVARMRRQNAKLRREECELELCLVQALEVVKSYIQPIRTSTRPRHLADHAALTSRGMAKPSGPLGTPSGPFENGQHGIDLQRVNALALSLSIGGNGLPSLARSAQVPQLVSSSGSSSALLFPSRRSHQFSFLQQTPTLSQCSDCSLPPEVVWALVGASHPSTSGQDLTGMGRCQPHHAKRSQLGDPSAPCPHF